ncbi:UNKNOWN [Stylonychia lemnae]|uniref:Uncharacterized protein n=1 Tax=Stylonychia lemnae TaxID=5949 RepID=A0A078A0V6_STYLE|nr:UNKNOWN [Stylonychia lemnae]|eukprot:CDW75108.1 UNKNOWN [Stylonychia lemnae]
MYFSDNELESFQAADGMQGQSYLHIYLFMSSGRSLSNCGTQLNTQDSILFESLSKGQLLQYQSKQLFELKVKTSMPRPIPMKSNVPKNEQTVQRNKDLHPLELITQNPRQEKIIAIPLSTKVPQYIPFLNQSAF